MLYEKRGFKHWNEKSPETDPHRLGLNPGKAGPRTYSLTLRSSYFQIRKCIEVIASGASQRVGGGLIDYWTGCQPLLFYSSGPMRVVHGLWHNR
jgi:hypothetical protein